MKLFPLATLRRGATALTLSATCLLTFAGTCFAAPPKMGVWLPGANEAAVVRYETWTKQSMAPLIGFLPRENWEALTGTTAGYATNWALSQWDTAYRSRVNWSVGMLPDSGNITTSAGQVLVQSKPNPTLAAGAAGDYDQHWRNLADTLITKGYANTTLRLGWEFNGSWFKWYIGGSGQDAANYANYFKKIVRAMRSRPGANFKFNWCGSVGMGVDPSLAYPEADSLGSYVDEIGVDVYDTNWSYYPIDPALPQWDKDSRRENAWLATSQWGNYPLNWWATFAASKGKPLTIPEWGLADSTSEHGGGDNPIFIERFHEWLTKPANGVAWHAYFQEDVSFQSKIFEDPAPATFPNATVAFLQFFSGQATNIVFQNPVNNVTWTGGYGTKTVTLMGSDTTANRPFEGDKQYKITYTSSAGIQLGMNQIDVTPTTHLRLAIKGPITNSSQYVQVKLTASDGTMGPAVTLPRTADYTLQDIPLSSLSSGVTLSKINGLYFYPMPNSPTGVSDTFYLDNILFVKNTP